MFFLFVVCQDHLQGYIIVIQLISMIIFKSSCRVSRPLRSSTLLHGNVRIRWPYLHDAPYQSHLSYPVRGLPEDPSGTEGRYAFLHVTKH